MPACSLAGVHFIGFLIFDNFGLFWYFLVSWRHPAREKKEERRTQNKKQEEQEEEEEEEEEEEIKQKKIKRKNKKKKEKMKSNHLKKGLLGEKGKILWNCWEMALLWSVGCHTSLSIQAVSVLLQSFFFLSFFCFSCLSFVFLDYFFCFSWLFLFLLSFFCLSCFKALLSWFRLSYCCLAKWHPWNKKKLAPKKGTQKTASVLQSQCRTPKPLSFCYPTGSAEPVALEGKCAGLTVKPAHIHVGKKMHLSGTFMLQSLPISTG